MSFKENFVRLCNEKGVAPSKVVESIGLKRSAFSQWTDESVPRQATLMRIADYFGVTVDYLVGGKSEDKPLTEMESALLELFRRLPEDKQAVAIRMIQAALKA